MITKDFDTLAVLGLTSGMLLQEGGFSKIHELAEWVMGHDIWTHEFADKQLWHKMKVAVFAQHPSLEEIEFTPDNWKEKASEAVVRFGAMLPIRFGDNDRTENPVESLARISPGKKAIVIDNLPIS